VSDQVGCGPDLVREGENGSIFTAGNIAGLCRALKNILDNEPQCRALGRKGLEIINTWGIEEDVAGLKAALAQVMKDK
jgi:glycosyltransferase involved in cell wall biosynthesis